MVVCSICMPASVVCLPLESMVASRSETGLFSEEAHMMCSGIRMRPSARVTFSA